MPFKLKFSIDSFETFICDNPNGVLSVFVTSIKVVRVLLLMIPLVSDKWVSNELFATASRLNLAHLGHKKLIFDCFECSFVDFFLLKYLLTQAQVIKAFY